MRLILIPQRRLVGSAEFSAKLGDLAVQCDGRTKALLLFSNNFESVVATVVGNDVNYTVSGGSLGIKSN